MAEEKPPQDRPEHQRITSIGAEIDVDCPRCGRHTIVLVQLGSEADLVRCENCEFSFGFEQGDV